MSSASRPLRPFDNLPAGNIENGPPSRRAESSPVAKERVKRWQISMFRMGVYLTLSCVALGVARHYVLNDADLSPTAQSPDDLSSLRQMSIRVPVEGAPEGTSYILCITYDVSSGNPDIPPAFAVGLKDYIRMKPDDPMIQVGRVEFGNPKADIEIADGGPDPTVAILADNELHMLEEFAATLPAGGLTHEQAAPNNKEKKKNEDT